MILKEELEENIGASSQHGFVHADQLGGIVSIPRTYDGIPSVEDIVVVEEIKYGKAGFCLETSEFPFVTTRNIYALEAGESSFIEFGIIDLNQGSA